MKINMHEFKEYLGALAGSDQVRWKAACGLAKYSDAEWEGTPEAVGDAVAALICPGAGTAPDEARFRAESAKVLGTIGTRSTAIIPELRRLLENDADEGVRAEAAKALGKIGAEAEGASAALTTLLADLTGTDRLRGEAARALARVAPEAPGTSVALRAALDDRSAHVVICAAEALWGVNRDAARAVPALAARLGQPRTRDSAVQALYRIGPEARTAVPALLVAAKDPDRLFRELVLMALQKIDPATLAKAGVR